MISDAHFPGHTFNARTLRTDGIGADALLAGIIPLFELDAFATPVIMMAAVSGDSLDPAVEEKYRKALGYDGKIERMERFAFYERAKKAYAVVISGEPRPDLEGYGTSGLMVNRPPRQLSSGRMELSRPSLPTES